MNKYVLFKMFRYDFISELHILSHLLGTITHGFVSVEENWLEFLLWHGYHKRRSQLQRTAEWRWSSVIRSVRRSQRHHWPRCLWGRRILTARQKLCLHSGVVPHVGRGFAVVVCCTIQKECEHLYMDVIARIGDWKEVSKQLSTNEREKWKLDH